MNDKQLFYRPGKLGLVLGAALLGTLTGCVAYVEPARPREVYEVAPPVQTTVVVEDDYVYYPNYEVYYSSSRHQYAYRDGRNWVSRPAPRGVSVDVLMAAPSVRMDFHDSPARHNDEIVRQYPRNWSPPGQKQERTEERQGEQRDQRDQHDNHGDNNKR
jgi:hypothetical protein